jgi:uncharacterized membrane protein (DUF485 family)
MATAALGRRVGKVVGYPPLSELSDLQRRELHESLLDARQLRDLPEFRSAPSVAGDVDWTHIGPGSRVTQNTIALVTLGRWVRGPPRADSHRRRSGPMTHSHGQGAGRAADRVEGERPLREGTSDSGPGGTAEHPEIDWVAAERSPEFRDLVRSRNAFVIPATLFFLAWYFGFIVLAGYAPDFMGEEFLTDGLTVGYVLALTQFVMTWVLGWMYLRRSDRAFDPLAKRAAAKALHAADGEQPTRRFARDEEPGRADEEVRPR